MTDYLPPIDPDCLAGKHLACMGRAWDEEHDVEVECACGCHELVNAATPRPIDDVVSTL